MSTFSTAYLKSLFDQNILQNKELLLSIIELTLQKEKNPNAFKIFVTRLLFDNSTAHVAYPAVSYIINNFTYEKFASVESLKEMFLGIYQLYSELIDFSKIKNNNVIDSFIKEAISKEIFSTQQKIQTNSSNISSQPESSNMMTALLQLNDIKAIGNQLLGIIGSLLKTEQLPENINNIKNFQPAKLA